MYCMDISNTVEIRLLFSSKITAHTSHNSPRRMMNTLTVFTTATRNERISENDRGRTVEAIWSSVIKNENRIFFSFRRINQRTFIHRLYDFCIARHAYHPPFYARLRRGVDISAPVSQPRSLSDT